LNNIISVLVPTRKRPQNIVELCKSAVETASDLIGIEFIFYVDRDDTDTIDFFKNNANTNTLNVAANVKIGDRVKLGQTYNEAYKLAKGDIIMYCADDVRFRTKNWNYLVWQEHRRYKKGIALVFGYDGIQPKGSLATHGFLSRAGIDALGYVHPGDIGYNYSDNWLTEIYKQIGRLVYYPIYFEHCHWGVGKAVYDETYRLGSDAPHKESQDIWHDKARLMQEIEKIKKAIND